MSELNEDFSSTDINSDSDLDTFVIENGILGERSVPNGDVSSTDVNSDIDLDNCIKVERLRVKTVKNHSLFVKGLSKGMKKQSSRNDFISDGSSDEECLPQMESLRERLVKKRQLQAGKASFVSSDEVDGSSSLVLSENVVRNIACESTLRSTLSPVPSKQTPDFSDSFEDENEKQTLSQIISSPVHQKMLNCYTNGFSINKTSTGSSTNSIQSLTKASSTDNLTYKAQMHVHRENSQHMFDCGSTVNTVSGDGPTDAKVRKKRTTQEVEENRRKAQEKKEEREKIRLAKEAEKQMRKVERESKKQFSLGSCLQFIKVLIDTHVVNVCGFGAKLLKECEDLGVTCQTQDLTMPFTIMWRRQVTECNMSTDMKVEKRLSEVDENEVLAIIPVADFIQMVNSYKQNQMGMFDTGVTLRDYVSQLRSCLVDKSISVIVPGLEQYFRDIKSQAQKQHREAVISTNRNRTSKLTKGKPPLTVVSRVDVEETITDTQLQTGCCTFMLETQEDVADLVKRFTKAVAERPAKKDRFDAVFSFHEEGCTGVKVDKNGVGLLKVWKQQLLQFKNVSPDVAQALIAEYPSPQLLRQAYRRCSSEKEAIKLLENIVVRRGAGVLETTRRIGKELSRRVYTFFNSSDPDLVIK